MHGVSTFKTTCNRRAEFLATGATRDTTLTPSANVDKKPARATVSHQLLDHAVQSPSVAFMDSCSQSFSMSMKMRSYRDAIVLSETTCKVGARFVSVCGGKVKRFVSVGRVKRLDLEGVLMWGERRGETKGVLEGGRKSNWKLR